MLFGIALKFTAQKIKYTVLSVLLCVICVTVIVFTSILSSGVAHAYNSVDALLTGGAEKAALIRIEDANGDLIDELASQPEISAVGTYVSYPVDYFSDLIKIRNNALGVSENRIDVINMSDKLFGFCNISLRSGEIMTDIPNERTVYLYLGAGYKDVPLGTVYSTQWFDYTVAGILSDGQRLLSTSLSSYIDQNQADYTFDGAYGILEVGRAASSNEMWLCAAEGYSIDEAIEKAFSAADKYNEKLRYSTLQTIFERANEDVMVMKSIFSKLTPVLCIACIIMIICMQLSDIYGSFHEYGVLCAAGFTQSDLEKIMIIKNIITFVTAFIISLPLFIITLRWWYSQNSGDNDAVTKILFNTAVPAAAILVLGVLTISAVISAAVIRRHTTVQMIGGYND